MPTLNFCTLLIARFSSLAVLVGYMPELKFKIFLSSIFPCVVVIPAFNLTAEIKTSEAFSAIFKSEHDNFKVFRMK